jgi:tRNA-specific 2-thiouridylase
VELVTVGQRRGLGLPGGGAPRYVVDVDVPAATVRVGSRRDLMSASVLLGDVVWASGPVRGRVRAQCSAHGEPRPATVGPDGDRAGSTSVRFDEPHRRVAAGQSVVLYEGDEVVGGGIARHERRR